MKLYGIWDVFVVVVDDFCFSKRFNDVLELENITTRHWIIMPCCGLNGNGLENGLEWLMDDISSRIFMLG